MRIIITLMEVALAALAVVGLHSLLCEIFERVLIPRDCRLTAAVFLYHREDVERLDILLSEAWRHTVRRRGMPPVLLIDAAILPHLTDADGEVLPAYREPIERYGALCVVLEVRGE